MRMSCSQDVIKRSNNQEGLKGQIFWKSEKLVSFIARSLVDMFDISRRIL